MYNSDFEALRIKDRLGRANIEVLYHQLQCTCIDF